MPREKFFVPSSGSMTHIQPSVRVSLAVSSLRMACAGNSRARMAVTARSTARSVSVTTFPRPFTPATPVCP